MRSLALIFLSICACGFTTMAGGDTSRPDQPYIAAGIDLAYGPDPRQVLDIYYHARRDQASGTVRAEKLPRPTLILIHGGGWMSGSKDWVTSAAVPYRQRGWNVVNLEYRIGTGTAPAAADDVMAAIAWTVDHAAHYGLDLNRVVLSGYSAGGHLALLAGMLNTIKDSHPHYVGDRLRVRAVVNYFGITDIADIWAFLEPASPQQNYVKPWIGDKARLAEISAKYSPIHFITANTPPVLSIHGDRDPTVPVRQAKRLHEQLNTLGLPNQLLIQHGAGHGRFSAAQEQRIMTSLFTFLEHIAKIEPVP